MYSFYCYQGYVDEAVLVYRFESLQRSLQNHFLIGGLILVDFTVFSKN